MDYADLIAGVSYAGLLAAFAAIGALKAVPVAARWGVSKLLGMLGR